ncbi:Uncharacterised protein [Mycobacteroides abscessus subsp. abscessus]|nr:Uncharacterised protein [Mycobacteroides abscessus subsp. abscessus]
MGFQVFDVVDNRDVLVGVDADAAPFLGRGYQPERLPLADVACRHGHPLCQLVDSQVHREKDYPIVRYGKFRYVYAWNVNGRDSHDRRCPGELPENPADLLPLW